MNDSAEPNLHAATAGRTRPTSTRWEWSCWRPDGRRCRSRRRLPLRLPASTSTGLNRRRARMPRPAPSVQGRMLRRLRPAGGGRSRPACARSSNGASIPTPAGVIAADWSWPRTSTAGGRPAAGLHRRAVLGPDRAAVVAASAQGDLHRGLVAGYHPGHDSRCARASRKRLCGPSGCTRSAGSGTTLKHALTASRRQIPRACSRPTTLRVETATRALKEYDVLGTDDWRRRDDVRALPKAEREDLEVWLMEQVYLYCRALADRPESPRDWSRAVRDLDSHRWARSHPGFRCTASASFECEITGESESSSTSSDRPFRSTRGLPGLTSTCSASSPSAN